MGPLHHEAAGAASGVFNTIPTTADLPPGGRDRSLVGCGLDIAAVTGEPVFQAQGKDAQIRAISFEPFPAM
jgi:hypothetical protein